MTLISPPKFGKKTNLLIIGAGKAGELIGKHLITNPHLNYNILAFIDDDFSKIGQALLDIPIVGPINKLKEIINRRRPDEILIAMPSATGSLVKQIFYECEDIGVNIKILPTSYRDLNLLKEGKAGFEKVRPIEISDFFIRKPVITNINEIKDFFDDKTILITGCAGSIGSELCAQLLELSPKEIIALDNQETALHELSLKFMKKYNGKFLPIIADIKDSKKINYVLEKYKPSIIFHTAAYKHVPMMELHPDEAVKTNVFGTKNLVDLSEKHNVEHFIFISTDKSVNPRSVMGVTKKISEMIVHNKSRKSPTKFVTVRFGNVLNSNGSAIPLFEKQIDKGGPVTLTDIEMKRFFMSIPEAAQLVIQSVLMGKSGEIFILDMGKQYKILDIVEDMIRLRGLKPHKDIKIETMGLRPGEKLYEELTNFHELKESTNNERIFLIKNHVFCENEKLEKDLQALKELAEKVDKHPILLKLREIVPDFLKEENV